MFLWNLKNGKRPYKPVGSESLQILESLVRWTDRLDVTISADWDILNITTTTNKETAIRDLETVVGPMAEER